MTERVEDGGPAVTVKLLEWASEPPYSVARIFPLKGHYAVEAWYDDEGGCHVDLTGPFITMVNAFSTVADAKSAAQADYERRILSALVIIPARARQMGLDVGGANG